jgi:hypothetical protein
MAKVQVDLNGVKQFLLSYGERVGLAVAGLVMVIFLFLGALEAVLSSSPAKRIKDAAQDLQRKINPTGQPIAEPPPPSAPTWFGLAHPRWFATRPWEWIESATDSRRRNPEILPVGELVPSKEQGAPPKVIGVATEVVRGPVRSFLLKLEERQVMVFTKNAPPRKTPAAGFPGAGGPPLVSQTGAPGSAQLAAQYGGPAGAMTDGGQEPVYTIKPARMIVVYGTFPYRQQLELYRKALRKNSIEELFPSKLAPKILGLNVVRYEVEQDKEGRLKYGKPEVLYTFDPKTGKAIIGEKKFEQTYELFRHSPYDQDSTGTLQQAGLLVDGLDTPLPELADGHYRVPVEELPGIKIKQKTDVAQAEGFPGMPYQFFGGPGIPKGAGSKGGLPGVGGQPPGLPGLTPSSGGVQPESDYKKYTTLPEPLKKEFARRFNLKLLHLFNPFGAPAAQQQMSGLPYGPGVQPTPDATTGKEKKNEDGEPDDESPPPAPGFPGGVPQPGTVGQGSEASASLPEKVLVRFFDADVEPGKTYVYAMQVRVKNPNYKEFDKVAYRKLAEEEFLFSGWTFTSPTTVPPEWDFYVVDQLVMDHQKRSRVENLEKGLPPPGPGQVSVQIHKWMKNVVDENGNLRDLGDWEVLERLRLYRGDPVSRSHAPGVVPIWNMDKDSFQVEKLHVKKNKGGLDYSPPKGPPPVVVDFTGGHEVAYAVPGKSSIRDDAAVELLLLGSDGKLFLRSARMDSDPSTPRGALRWRIYNQWVERVARLARQAEGRPADEKEKKER